MDKLNPKIYDEEGKMLPEVREKLLMVVDEFIKSTEELGVDFIPLDVVVVGSNAAYNYTDQSDLDLHMIVNLEEISEKCPDLLNKFFDADRRLFNKNYDMTVRGIPVEVYVEDIKTNTNTNGMYSVMNNEWIKYPQYKEVNEVDKTSGEWLDTLDLAETLLSSGTSEEIESYINSLYLSRKYSLLVDGENGQCNLVFKELRNLGILDQLKNRLLNIRSRELSVESVKGYLIRA